MTAIVADRPPATSARLTLDRLAGISALVFVALVVIQNALGATVVPGPSASVVDVSQFASDHRWAIYLMTVTYLVGLPALLLWSAKVAEIARSEDDPISAVWAQAGRTGVALIAVFFALVNITDIVLATTNAGDHTTIALLWHLHWAIFIINLAAVGVALLGLGLASVRVGIAAPWLVRTTIAGAALLFVGAAPAVAGLHGFPVIAIALPGYAAWVALLLATGIRLARGD